MKLLFTRNESPFRPATQSLRQVAPNAAVANVRSLFHLGEYHWRRSVQVACQKNVVISEGYKLFTKTAQS